MVTQLSNTKKHKDELRKARRGSAPKQADVAAAGERRRKNMMTRKYYCNNCPGGNRRQESRTQEVVSDSGAESCNEETRRRTAEAFMTGIMSSIPGTEAARPVPGQEGASPQEDIVSEVRPDDS